MERLLPLDLVFDYPVRWSRYKVLRDLGQNFYDAVRYDEWEKRFAFDLRGDSLWLRADGISFSYDWLIPIGASTKRDSTGRYAGYFGEGFKIAALCAVRDYGWNVEVQSRNWRLSVTVADRLVDGVRLTTLAYRVLEGQVWAVDTQLCLRPFADGDLLRCVLLSFYYPGNPLLGQKFWESAEGAVYLRSAVHKPAGYPATYSDAGAGIIFAGYQAFGSFSHPLVFCLHEFRDHDRERSTFYRMQVVDVVGQVAKKLSANASAIVLERLRRCWRACQRKRYDFESWAPIVQALVSNIAASGEDARCWRERHPDLLAAMGVKRSSAITYNRRQQALAWLRRSERRGIVVQDAFTKLGYPTVEQVCEEAGGFSVLREPTPAEANRIRAIDGVCLRLFPEIFDGGRPPVCKVIDGDRAVWQGLASCLNPAIPNASIP